MVGKGENAGNQHFLLYPSCFQNVLYVKVKKRKVKVKGQEKVVKGSRMKLNLHKTCANEVKYLQATFSTTKRTKCVCETLMPTKHPSFEKHDSDI